MSAYLAQLHQDHKRRQNIFFGPRPEPAPTPEMPPPPPPPPRPVVVKPPEPALVEVMMAPNPGRLTVRSIGIYVERYFDLDFGILKSPTRKWVIVRPRQIAFYLASKYLGASLPQIGLVFYKDHTTVLSGVRKIEKMMITDPQIALDVASIALDLGIDLNCEKSTN